MKEVPAVKCPVHVGVPMKFVESVRRIVHLRRKGPSVNDLGDFSDVKHRPGIFRCAVVGCPRVELPENVREPSRKCPQCGDPSDAPEHRKAIYDYRCKRCKGNAQRRQTAAFKKKHGTTRWHAAKKVGEHEG